MGRITKPFARNIIKRAIQELVDPSPTRSQLAELRQYFGYSCCFCQSKVEERRGHIDHLRADSEGGLNHISNRVLSCGKCNGDEKREMDWEVFLRSKSQDEAEFESRKKKILDWVARGGTPELDEARLTQAKNAAHRVLAEFDRACEEVVSDKGK